MASRTTKWQSWVGWAFLALLTLLALLTVGTLLLSFPKTQLLVFVTELVTGREQETETTELPPIPAPVPPPVRRIGIGAAMFDAKSSEALRLRGHAGTIFALAFSPDGRFLASGDYDGVIKIWDLRDGSVKCTLSEHKFGVRCLAFSRNGRQLLSTGDGHFINVWDVEHGKLMNQVKVGVGSIRQFALTADPVQIVTVDTFIRIRKWNLAKGESILTKIRANPGALSHDGRFALTAMHPGTVELWDLQTETVLRTYSENEIHFGALSISPDGRFVAASNSLSRTGRQPLRVWKRETAQRYRLFSQNKTWVLHLEFSPNGRYLLAVGAPGAIPGARKKPVPKTSFTLWNVETGRRVPISFLEGGEASFSPRYSGFAYAGRFSPNSRYAATAGMGGDVHVWKLPDDD